MRMHRLSNDTMLDELYLGDYRSDSKVVAPLPRGAQR